LCFVQESLLAMNKLRQEVELEKSRAKLDGCNFEKDLEMCIRTKNNAWVISRVTRGKELYMVLEKANETLLYASDAVEKFSDKYVIAFLSLVWLIVYLLCSNCYPHWENIFFLLHSMFTFSLLFTKMWLFSKFHIENGENNIL